MRKPIARRAALWTGAGVLVLAILAAWAVARAARDSTAAIDELERLHRLEQRIDAAMPRPPGGPGGGAAVPGSPVPSPDSIQVAATPTERGTEVRVGERRWVLPRAEAERGPVLALVREEIARAAEALVARGRKVSVHLVTPSSDDGLLASDVAALMDAILGAGVRDVGFASAPPVLPEAPAPAGR